MINYVSSSFDLFGLTIHWYAVCILIGIVLAVVAGVREGKKSVFQAIIFIPDWSLYCHARSSGPDCGMSCLI